MSNCTRQTAHVVKVPEYKPTEPAMTALFDALRIRGEREQSFDPNLLYGEKREEYLVSFLKTRFRLTILYLMDSVASLQDHECCARFYCHSPDLQLSIAPCTPA